MIHEVGKILLLIACVAGMYGMDSISHIAPSICLLSLVVDAAADTIAKAIKAKE